MKLLVQFTSHDSSLLSTQIELITYFRYHVTEYRAVIGMHPTVQGDKLLYGYVPDPFLPCGTGSGHIRLIPHTHNTQTSPMMEVRSPVHSHATH